MTGLMTIVLFSVIAAGGWPNNPLVTYIAGGLALLRLIVLVRQWR